MKLRREKNIYQLSFLPRAFPVNCYLVEEDNELMLIDAALPYSAKSILQAAAVIGKPITRILLTHAHEDHVGALDALKAALPDVRVHISARDARLMDGDRSLDPGEPQTPIRGGIAGQLKPLFPFPAFGTWNKHAALESARRLRNLKPSLLGVGHGRMVQQPAEAMDLAILAAERNLNSSKQGS